MSAHGGPNIDKTGLVFAYDMNNTNKSWKGAPTTNLANVSLNGMSGVSLTYLGMDGDWKKYSMSGTFTGGTYPFILSITAISFTGGTTYSSSCYIKTSAISKFNYFGTGMNYVNQPMTKGGTSFSVLQDDGSFYIGRSNFAYTSTTTQTGYILSNPINNTVFNSSTDFVWIKDGQIELGEFPTPFAGNLSTRSNSQSLLDLAGNNTITVDSLTYNSDGTFSFNGTSDYMTSSLTCDKNYYSINWWLYPTTRTNFNQGLSINSGWDNWSFHTTANGEIYVGTNVATRMTPTNLPANTLIVNQWQNFCYTFNNGIGSFYKNGVLLATKSGMSISANTFSSITATIGTTGRLTSLSTYSRVLTAAEVKQNFNALKGRYGL